MIRKTLKAAREATFCVELPNSGHHGMPVPTGTGFFISPDGWFVTAAHVVSSNGQNRTDIDKAWLMKESVGFGPGAMCQFLTLEHVLSEFDFALIKVDFDRNSNKEWLKDRMNFPFLRVSTRQLDMGEPVYSFGYPLSSAETKNNAGVIIGSSQFSPRLTSAIVSSDIDKTQMVTTNVDPRHYVLDKALNYGNSGGPIISAETGHVHALCSRFQPLIVPQNHLKDSNGNILQIFMPSLYGVVSSLNNQPIIDLLRKLNIPLVNT